MSRQTSKAIYLSHPLYVRKTAHLPIDVCVKPDTPCDLNFYQSLMHKN